MKVVALVSGGKDSTYNMMQCVAAGHELLALAHLHPEQGKEELDSAMFQTVGHSAVQAIASAMQLPLFARPFSGRCTNSNLHYEPAAGDEVEDLFKLLQEVKSELPVDAVSVGAILSTYQRVRVESVCQRLGLTCLAYLWQRQQEELLEELVKAGVEAVVIKVAAMGLTVSHLGRSISELRPVFLSLNSKYDMNVCGEGGEYETFTVNCPLFKKRLRLHSVENVLHSDDAFAPVAYLSFSVTLEDKGILEEEAVADIPVHSHSTLSESPTELSLQKWVPTPVPRVRFDDLSASKLRTVVKAPFAWLTVESRESDNEAADEAIHFVIENMQRQILETSLALSDICCVQLYLRQMSDYAAVNAVYCKTFGFNPPVRACVAAPISCTVCIGCSLAQASGATAAQGWQRGTLHVQSVSHWAPANIGPYSQGVTFGPLLWVSGQIGLVPGSMKLAIGGVLEEGRLALRHVHRVLDVHQCCLKDCVLVTAFVTSIDALPTVGALWSEMSTENVVLDAVHVTGLPRGAKIEWQALALREGSLSDRLGFSSSFSGWELRTDVLSSLEQGILVVRTAVETHSADVELNGMVLATHLQEAVSVAAVRASLALSPNTSVLHAQLFADQELPGKQLKLTIEQAFQDCNLPLSLLHVPVVHCRQGILSLQFVFHNVVED